MTTNLSKAAPAQAQTASPVAPLVDISGLNIGYQRNRKIVPAVHDLDLQVHPGEVVAVVGESGSGKTTTANAIIGLLPANGRLTSGSIKIAGTEIAGAKEKVVRTLRGAVVGLIPQDPMVGLNPTQRIGVQVAEAVKLRGVKGPQIGDEVADALTKAGLGDPQLLAKRYPHELSGGQRQRVLIAIALAGKPDLIIADEPTSALDVTVQARILDHLESLVRDTGIALLIITHDLAVAADRADRVVVMQHGRIVEQGSPARILVDPADSYTRRLIGAAPALAQGGIIKPRFVVADDAGRGEQSGHRTHLGRQEVPDQPHRNIHRTRRRLGAGRAGSHPRTRRRIGFGKDHHPASGDGARETDDGPSAVRGHRHHRPVVARAPPAAPPLPTGPPGSIRIARPTIHGARQHHRTTGVLPDR